MVNCIFNTFLGQQTGVHSGFFGDTPKLPYHPFVRQYLTRLDGLRDTCTHPVDEQRYVAETEY